MNVEPGLLKGILPHPLDAQIQKAIAAAKLRGDATSYSIVGFRNEHGHIYRQDIAHGLDQQNELCDHLWDLGFAVDTDRGTPRGYWCVFVTFQLLMELEASRERWGITAAATARGRLFLVRSDADQETAK